MMVIDKYSANHYHWGGDCDSWVLLDRDALSVKEEAMPPGTREMLHRHQYAGQFFYVLKGEATFWMDGEKTMVGEQQGVYIPAGTAHYISNESDKRLSFLVISQPSTNLDRENL